MKQYWDHVHLAQFLPSWHLQNYSIASRPEYWHWWYNSQIWFGFLQFCFFSFVHMCGFSPVQFVTCVGLCIYYDNQDLERFQGHKNHLGSFIATPTFLRLFLSNLYAFHFLFLHALQCLGFLVLCWIRVMRPDILACFSPERENPQWFTVKDDFFYQIEVIPHYY